MWPGLDEGVELVPGTLRTAGRFGLPVAVELIVHLDLACLHHATAQVMEGLRTRALYTVRKFY